MFLYVSLAQRLSEREGGRERGRELFSIIANRLFEIA